MPFVQDMLNQNRPTRLSDITLPRRQDYFPSPVDWRDEVLYFLLPDRFSDGGEAARSLLDRSNLLAARLALPSGTPWQWNLWASSGQSRWQGGTLQGIASKLDYLRTLGVSTIWIGPVFKQRTFLNTYHGYGIQDFLEVDPHFGTRSDLVNLVRAAHRVGIRIILDVIFNHSGSNWEYPANTSGGTDKPAYTSGRYPFGSWRDTNNQPIAAIAGPEDGVWPVEFQDPDDYTRAGKGNLGSMYSDDPNAEFRRCDFENLRDFYLDNPQVLNDLVECFKYWIALTDCDGFRIDTVKHVTFEQARNFCGAIKEFATNLGKKNFFLVAEVAGGDDIAEKYLSVLGRNLDAALDIGNIRLKLNDLAKGLLPNPYDYFNSFVPGTAALGSHRNLGDKVVSVLDDHDHVAGTKIRFSSEASSDYQVVAGVALQLYTLGIPCIYYGTEQAFAGPEESERKWLPGWKGRDDQYLREAMFGPPHPLKSGFAGLQATPLHLDDTLPGFGPFGTAGHHCFDPNHPAYIRIVKLTEVRRTFPVLRFGRQYARQISLLGGTYNFYGPGQLVAWSRILDDEEALCVLNSHGTQSRGADIIVDANLNGANMTVILNTAETAAVAAAQPYTGSHLVGSAVPVRRGANGSAYVEIRDVAPSEVLVLVNHPVAIA